MGLRALGVFGLLLQVLCGCQQGSGCDLVQVAQVPLEPRGRLFAIPVTLNDHAIRMLLDTGSQKSVLAEPTVSRLAIVRDARFYSAMVGLSGGLARADASITGLSIGGAPVSLDRMPVTTLSGKIGVDGVLGLDVLRDYDLDIDGPQRLLTLYRVRTCDHADPPWSEPVTSVSDTGTLMGWLRMPFEINGVTGIATLDTGASYTMIMPRMARRLGLTDEAVANDRSVNLHVIAGDDAKARVHRFDTVRIGPVIVSNASILVLTREPPVLGDSRNFGDGLIGQDFLSSRRVWFSIRTGRLYFSRRDGETGH